MSDSNDPLAEEFKKFMAPSLPADLWQVVRDSTHEDLRESNNFDIANHFPLALSMTDELVKHSIGAMPDFCDTTPLLGYGGRAFYPIPEFVEYFAHQEARAITDVKNAWLLNQERQLAGDPIFQLLNESARAQALSSPAYSQMRDSNLSQPIRAAQADAWSVTAEALRVLTRKAHNYWAERGLMFLMRPMYAMNSTYVANIMGSSPLAGIPLPESYMTKGQLAFIDLMRTELDHRYDSNWLSYFDARAGTPFPHMAETVPLMTRENAMHWLLLGASAMLKQGSEALVWTRRNMPPWLLLHSAHRFAVYTDRNRVDTCLIFDTIKKTRFFDPDIFFSEAKFGPSRVEFTELDYKLVQLHVMGMTLAATQLQLGSGNKKPTWMYTPMNKIAIQRYAQLVKELTDHAL